MPLTSLDELNLDTFVRYEGTQGPDGSINARKIVFHHGELEPGEAKLWRRMEPKIKEPDYSSFAPGELKMHWEKNATSFPTAKPRTISPSSGKTWFPRTRRTSRPMIR